MYTLCLRLGVSKRDLIRASFSDRARYRFLLNKSAAACAIMDSGVNDLTIIYESAVGIGNVRRDTLRWCSICAIYNDIDLLQVQQ